MWKGSCTTIRGLQAFVFPYFLRWVWLWKSSKLHRSYPWPTGYLVTQVTGMNRSFSLSKLTPWLSTLSLTLVGCRLCNGKQEGKVFCSCTSQALGSLVNAPGSQGEYTAVKYGSVSGLTSDLPRGSGHCKEGNSHQRERLIFFLGFFLKMTCQWCHLYNLLENKSHMPRNKAPQTKQPITLFRQLKGIL